MTVDAVNITKPIYNYGGNEWKSEPAPTGGTGQFQMIIPPMPGPNKQVYGGIPFAKGALLNKVNARVLKNGAEIPASFETLCLWPDDSIKSLGVGVVTSTSIGGESELTLIYDSSQQQAYTGLTVTQNANDWTIDTGIGVFVINTDTFNFLEYSVGGNQVISGGDIEAVKATDGNTYKLSLDSGFTVTKQFEDTQKVTFDLVGELTFSATVTGRIWIQYKFYYNCDYADITIQYVDNVDEEVAGGSPTNPLPISFSDYRVVVNHSLPSYALSTGLQDTYHTAGTGNVTGTITGTHRIDQVGTFNLPPSGHQNNINPNNNMSYSGEAIGDGNAGWLACYDSGKHFYMMQRFFWQQFPGRLEVTSTTASIYFHSVFEQTPDLTKPSDTALYKRPNTFYGNKRGTSKSYDIRIGGSNQAVNLIDIAYLKIAYDVYHLHLCAESAQIGASQILEDFVGFNADNQAFTDEQMSVFFNNLHQYYWQQGGAQTPGGTIQPYYDYFFGWRDFGCQLFQTTGIQWNPCEHPGKYSYFQYWLYAKNSVTSFMLTSRMLYERDKKVYRSRRKGFWSQVVTTGNVSGTTQYYYPSGEPNGTGHYVADHDDRGTYVTHASIGFLWLNYVLTGDRIALEAMQTCKGWLDEFMYLPYNQEYFPGNGNQLKEDQDRSMYLTAACMLDIYRATGDKTIFDPDSALTNWATYLRRYFKRIPNQWGGFNEPYRLLFNGTPLLDPRTNSEYCNYDDGTGTWLQIRAVQANVGTQIPSTGNSFWMLAGLVIYAIKFIEYDAALSNRSGVNLDEFKEMLYQTIRHNAIWGWRSSLNRFWYSNQNEQIQTNPGAEGYMAYALARTYELWHEDMTNDTLQFPIEYYDQMSYIKNTILEHYWSTLSQTYDAGAEYYRFGFWGNIDTGYFYEAIEAIRRVRQLS